MVNPRRSAVTLLAVLLFAIPFAAQTPVAAPTGKAPGAVAGDVTTDYFGTKVADPYRWMEGSAEGPKFMAFLKAQNDYTRAVLASLNGREQLLARIRELDNAVPAVRSWQRGGSSIFYLETAPGAKTSSLMVRDADGKPRKLLDPTSMDKGDSHAAIDYFAPSWDGRYVIAGVSLGGSENSVIHVIESSTGRMLPDAITRTQYAGPSWSVDSQSFYYARLQKLATDAPPSMVYENERVYLHVLGSDPEKDPAVFGSGVSTSVSVPKAGFVNVGITPGSDYAVAFYSAGTTDLPSLYIAPVRQVKDAGTPWRKIVSAEDQVSTSADNSLTQHGSTLYLLLEKGSPNRQLVALDLDHPDIAHATVLVPPGDSLLTGIYAAKDGLYLTSKRSVEFDLQRSDYGPQLKWQKVALPYNGTISGFDANVLLPGAVFGLESWTHSEQALAYAPAANRVSNTNLIQKHPADFGSIDAREVEVPSTDGAKVALSILCKKGLALDGSHPTLYEGYGSYGISIDPYFDPRILAWLERGGVYAVVHARGGGEYGEAWHNAGRKQNKQHTIDDMVAAAEYLNQQRYSSPEHLAVMGTSAGGIAVGGAIVQHPELFVAAIDNVGMTDLLRFQISQGGAANIPEFGDVTEAEGFKYLYAVSPYNHVVAGTKYPAVLGITGTNDPRVPTWMVAKMIARLQAATTSGRPAMLRVDFDAGHGFGSSRPQREAQLADELSFILWQSGDPGFRPKK